MVPCTLKVCAEHQKLRTFCVAQRRPLLSVKLCEFRLYFSNDLQAFVPPTLQLGRNDSILRVYRIVLSLGSIALRRTQWVSIARVLLGTRDAASAGARNRETKRGGGLLIDLSARF